MTVSPSPSRVDWRTLLLALFFLVSAVGLFGLAALMFVFAVSTLSGSDQTMSLTLFVMAGGMFFGTLLLAPGVYLNARGFLGFADGELHLPALNEEVMFVLLAALWVLALVLGQSVSSNTLGLIVLPAINVMAVGLPVIFFLRVALRRLELPPARHGWSVFGVTLVIGPIAGILLEGIVLVIFMFGAGIYAGKSPELARQMTQLAELVKNSVSSDAIITAAAPIIFSPGGLLILVGLFSVAVPAIEEAIKVSALWLFADKIKTPLQGFALGVLCGAAFALAENLGFSSTGAGDWLSTASLRASSALPHMLNTGILGWAAVSAWQKHTYGRLGVAYAAVMLIHGTWNAISLAIWLNSLVPYAPNAPHFILNPVPFFAGWITMIIGTFLGLMYCNRALFQGSRPLQAGYNEPLPNPKSGEDHD